MEQDKLNKFWKWFSIACIFILGFVLSRVTSCEHPVIIGGGDTLKDKIKTITKVRDSVKTVVITQEKERIVYVNRYRTVTTYTTLPCDTVLKLVKTACDSIIIHDSVLIGNLKSVIKMDSVIIVSQQSVIRIDSNEIVGLNKQIRKHKRQKKLIAVGMGALLGLSLFRK